MVFTTGASAQAVGARIGLGRAQDEPLYRHYVSLLDGGTKPSLAKLTIA